MSCSKTSVKEDEYSIIIDNLLRYRFNDADMIIIETTKLSIQDTTDLIYEHTEISLDMLNWLADKKIISHNDAIYMYKNIDTTSINIDTTGYDVKCMHQDSLKNIYSKMDLDSAYEYLRKELGIYNLIEVSTPLYSKDRNTFIMFVACHCGSLCGQGYILVLTKTGNKWRIVEEAGTWES